MATLAEATTPRRDGERIVFDVLPGWRQGRGAYGGLCVAALIRAIELHVDNASRAVRSVTAELPGALEPGRVDIAVETLRTGKHMSTVRAAIVQGGETRSHAVAILAETRTATASWNQLARPAAPAFSADGPPAAFPMPEFAAHFEYRLVSGVPFSNTPPETIGWIRPRDPGAPRDAAYIAAVIDAWWPSVLNRFQTFRPMATIAFTLDIVAGLAGVAPDAPLLYRGTAPVCADGYFLETRELWTDDGRLVALNQQTFAIIA